MTMKLTVHVHNLGLDTEKLTDLYPCLYPRYELCMKITVVYMAFLMKSSTCVYGMKALAILKLCCMSVGLTCALVVSIVESTFFGCIW